MRKKEREIVRERDSEREREREREGDSEREREPIKVIFSHSHHVGIKFGSLSLI